MPFLSGMVVRRALVALWLSLCGGPLFALGLGDIELESGLNEPLVARIPLLKTGDLTDSELHANLASVEDFNSRKMSRDMLYTAIRFVVDLKHPQGPCVWLRTEKPVKEPAMDFLVELSWPGGRLLRAFTVLLEKPGS